MKVITAQGDTFELGVTETAPTIGITDYSRRVTDDFGVTTVVERGFARRMTVALGVPFDQVDELQRRLADLRATAAMWVADERFGSLSFRGYYKDFSLDLATPPLSRCTLTVEGLVAAEAFVDTGADPAPDGAGSTLQLLQPVIAADGSLAAHNVPENDAADWSADTAYPLGARVISRATHRVFESVAPANAGNDPTGVSGKWLDIGPTNRWAMFDQALGTATSFPGSVSVTLNAAIDAVALLDVVGATVRVEAAGYDRTIAVGAGAVTFLDLPLVGQVTVTIAGPGPVSVGTLLVGRLVALGITEASPTAGITDYSRKETDDFGDVTVVPRGWAKRMAANALIRTDAVDLVAGRIASVRARPSLWIGQDGLDSLTVYGFFKDFSIEVSENVSKLSLSVEGLSKAAPARPFAPGAGEVAWPDVKDTDPTRPKPQNGADVTSENTSKDTNAVGGKPAGEVLDHLGALDEAIANVREALDDTNAGAVQAALDARDASIAAAANSAAARDQSQAARDAAQAAQDQALASAQAAAGSFGTAQDQATIATRKADEAGEQATIASGHATVAVTKAGEASVSASEAATSQSSAAGSANSAAISAEVAASARDAAGLSAQAASGSASTAAASSDQAGQHASAAESSRTDAQTAAGQANTYRDQASTSASNAAGSASAASTQARLAATSALSRGLTPNADLTIGPDGWSTDMEWIGDVGDASGVLRDPTGRRSAVATPPTPVNMTSIYRLRGRFAIRSGGSYSSHYMGLTCYDAAGSNLGNVYLPSAVGQALPGSWYEREGTFKGALPLGGGPPWFTGGEGFLPGTVSVAPLFLSNYSFDAVVVDLDYLYLEEYTIAADAAGYAQAANTSASTASAKSDEAGASASAASSSAQRAEGFSGTANTAAQAAQGSAAAADGSRSSAASYADLAAQYRDQASGSAGAADSSARSAQASSAAADGRASAAQSSAELAAGYKNQAVDAAAAANSSAEAVTNAAGALAQKVDAVEATANGASANASSAITAVSDVKTGLAGARVRLLANSSGGYAAFDIWSDNNSGAGWQLTGNGRISGDLTIDGTISTGKIANGAITTALAAETLQSVTVPWEDASAHYGIQVTIPSATGAAVRIDFKTLTNSAGNGAGPPFNVVIERVANGQAQTLPSTAATAGGILLDYPPANTAVTYRFRYGHQYAGQNGSSVVIYQQLFVLELKK